MTTTDNAGGAPGEFTIAHLFPDVEGQDVEGAQREMLRVRTEHVDRQLGRLGVCGSYIPQYHSLPLSDTWRHVVLRPYKQRTSLPHITVCDVYDGWGISYDFVANTPDAAFSRVKTIWDRTPTNKDYNDTQRGGFIWTTTDDDGFMLAICQSGRGFRVPEPDVKDFTVKPQNLFRRRNTPAVVDTVLLRIMQQVEIAGELLGFLEMLGDTSHEKDMDIQLQ